MRLAALLPLLCAAAALGQTPAAPPAPAAATSVPPQTLRVLPTGGLRVETAALLLSGQEGGNLPLAVLALPLPGGAGGQARVPVVVEADGTALLVGHEEGPLRVEVCLYALGAGGGVEAALLNTVEIQPAGLATVEKSGLRFEAELLLPPGEVSLRVLVRTAAGKILGLRQVALSVPDFHRGRSGPALLLPPLVAEPADAWLRGRAAEGGAGLPGGVPPPAARPVLLPEGEVSFQAFAASPGLEPRLAAELRKVGGERSTRLPVRLAGRTEESDLTVLTGSFTLKSVDPGEYELRLVLLGSEPEVRSAPLPAVVSPEGSGRVWATLPALPAPAEEKAAAQAPGKRHRFASGPLEAAFREALKPLAAGDEPAARRAVADFEIARLTTDRPPLSPDELAEVEARGVQRFTQRDPELLVPLLLLFERLYHETWDRRAYQRATHDGEVVLGLAQLYVRQSRSPGAKELASGFLTALARGQLAHGVNLLCRQALVRAITLDEGNEAAVLALASDSGRRGEVRTAIELLEKLLKRHPESLAGRLRLGVELARWGDAVRARRLLAEITEAHQTEPPAAERWLLSLAHQELARLELAGHNPAAAARTLDAGLARLPGDEELLLAKAALLDRRGEHGAARDLLAAISVAAEGTDSPRHRFNQPPDAALETAGARAEARAAERLEALAAAGKPRGSS